MKRALRYFIFFIIGIGSLTVAPMAQAAVYTQCPCYLLDAQGNPDPTQLDPSKGAVFNAVTGNVECSYVDAALATHNVVCKSLLQGMDTSIWLTGIVPALTRIRATRMSSGLPMSRASQTIRS